MKRILFIVALCYAFWCIFLGGWPLREFLLPFVVSGKLAIAVLVVCVLASRGWIPKLTRELIWETLIVAGILAAAAYLRFCGIAKTAGWMPTIDEPIIVQPVLRMIRTGSLDPMAYEYGGVWFYFLLVIYGITIVHLLSGFAYKEVASIPDQVFYVAGRYATALVSVGTVAIAYFTARRFFGKLPAAVAGVMLAFSTLSFMTSHQIRLDVALALFVLAAHYYFLRILEEPSSINYWMAGVLCGLAIGTKYTVVPILASLLLAHALAQNGKRLLSWNLLLALGSVVAVFVFFNFFAIAHLDQFFARLPRAVYHNLSPQHWSATDNRPLEYFRNLIYNGISVIALIPILFTLGQMIFSRDNKLLVLWCFPLLFLATVGSYPSGFPRYLLPVLPIFAILAGAGTKSLLERLAVRFPSAGTARAAVLAVVFIAALPALAAVQFLMEAGHELQPQVIASWVQQNVPGGSVIVVDPTGPILDETAYKFIPITYRDFQNPRNLKNAEYLVVSQDLFNRVPDDFHIVKEFPAQTQSLDRSFRVYQRAE